MHAGVVAADPSSLWQQRGEQIRRRLAAIQLRLEELRAYRLEKPAVPGDRLTSAQRHMIASQDAAEQAAAAGARAYLASAQAHERAALQHERSAAAGSGDRGEHERQAAAHWGAASADTQQAEDAQSRLPKHEDKLTG